MILLLFFLVYWICTSFVSTLLGQDQFKKLEESVIEEERARLGK